MSTLLLIVKILGLILVAALFLIKLISIFRSDEVASESGLINKLGRTAFEFKVGGFIIASSLMAAVTLFIIELEFYEATFWFYGERLEFNQNMQGLLQIQLILFAVISMAYCVRTYLVVSELDRGFFFGKTTLSKIISSSAVLSFFDFIIRAAILFIAIFALGRLLPDFPFNLSGEFQELKELCDNEEYAPNLSACVKDQIGYAVAYPNDVSSFTPADIPKRFQSLGPLMIILASITFIWSVVMLGYLKWKGGLEERVFESLDGGIHDHSFDDLVHSLKVQLWAPFLFLIGGLLFPLTSSLLLAGAVQNESELDWPSWVRFFSLSANSDPMTYARNASAVFAVVGICASLYLGGLLFWRSCKDLRGLTRRFEANIQSSKDTQSG